MEKRVSAPGLDQFKRPVTVSLLAEKFLPLTFSEKRQDSIIHSRRQIISLHIHRHSIRLTLSQDSLFFLFSTFSAG